MKKIKFQLYDDRLSLAIENPKPAISTLPEWYKKMKSFYGDKQKGSMEEIHQQTIKRCMPVRDAVGAGYHIFTSFDIVVSDTEEGGKEFSWIPNTPLISTHDINQVYGMDIPSEYYEKPYKWLNFLKIETPSGYSCLFTHPMLHFNLPFQTIPGIVDTDQMGLPINFPFFIRKDFVGVIPAGTPIAQVIPFKRDDWKLENEKPISQEEYSKLQVRFQKFVTRTYAKTAWSKKTYQ